MHVCVYKVILQIFILYQKKIYKILNKNKK